MDGELMELSSGIRSIEQLPLPPGFRFAPTDEELVWHYLKRQSDSGSFEFRVIAEVELYKFNPWDLPEKALFGEKEWYFFSPRDRKYPRGVRPNRAAASGYWKATGTDKLIYLSSVSGHRRHVGMKKSLVFYHGRAPASPESKTNWMMHEYRLADSEKPSTQLHRRGSQRLDGWVLCKVYMKPSSLAQRAASHEHEMESVFPALPEFGEQLQTDSATQEEDCVTTTSEATTFSTMMLNMSGAISSMVPSRQQTIASPSAWNLQHSIASNSQQARLTQELGAPLGQQTGPALSCNYLHLPQLQFHPQWPSSSFTTPGHYNARIESTAGQISTSDEVEEVQSPLQYYASNFEGALFTGDDQTPADDLSTYPMPPGMDSFSYGPSSGSL